MLSLVKGLGVTILGALIGLNLLAGAARPVGVVGDPCLSTSRFPANPHLASTSHRSATSPLGNEELARFFRLGEFSTVIARADGILNEGIGYDENVWLWKLRSEMAVGQYASALKTWSAASERFPNSLALRWYGADVLRYNDLAGEASRVLGEIRELWRRNSWRYRDPQNLLIVGQALLAGGADPRQVLDEYFRKASGIDPELPDPFLVIGELALAKQDFQLAATQFAEAIELDDSNPDAFCGLAKAYAASDLERSTTELARALAIQPRHVDSLLMLTDQHLNGEDYRAAERCLEEVIAVNPEQPMAWAYRAVLAHLDNRPNDEFSCRDRALLNWPGNPEVDHSIGKKLSQKYRFEEGAVYQRRALVYDPDFLPAKIQLATDLLRLGKEDEGWQLAQEVFESDQYDIVANNLVALRDNLSRFKTVERNGFVVRMERQEAEAYSHLVLALLEEARESLTEKYQAELKMPIYVELFSRQEDFAIRTFGIPGGNGYLGVCFGQVITMNSPTAQGSQPTNWRSVLWHEFCHVVTLQKTRNRMPRWLSEGISVYEESQADPAWGQSMNPVFRQMILEEELTPVSELSRAFLTADSPVKLEFAYFESSLVVRFLVENFGVQALRDTLDELSVGTPINLALSRHTIPISDLDIAFSKYARQLAEEFAPQANWERPSLSGESVADWNAWLQEDAARVLGWLGKARAQMKVGDLTGAVESLNEFDARVPQSKVSAEVWGLRAEIYRRSSRQDEELAALESRLLLDADDQGTCERLLEIHTSNESWEDVVRVARRFQGVNPLSPLPNAAMALAAERTSDDGLLLESLQVLRSLDPLDRADVHFRLAKVLQRLGRREEAKRNVLQALEAAPRFREAQRLLLTLVQESANLPKANSGDLDDGLGN